MSAARAARGGEHDAVVAFAGNPNVGKSTLFNALTGLRQHTGNWPGKTVGLASGACERGGKRYLLVDLPGTYSLSARSAEEEVARDYIKGGHADVTVIVCDATCLERNLNLVMQTLCVSGRAVVCVNLIDEAKKAGISINIPLLAELLGVPVACTNARDEEGIDSLFAAIEEALASPLSLRHSCCEGCANAAYCEAERICAACVSREKTRSFDRRLSMDRILTGRFTGFPVMLLLLALVFYITMKGANYPSALLSDLLFSLEAPLHSLLLSIGLPPLVCAALAEGAYRVLAWVVAVMLPPMAIFFPLFTLLEDLGYLPRVAFNLDGLFRGCRACGKQALTMCMGFGCNAVGVTGCRIIDSPRERLVAILTNSFVPCNGRFPLLIAVVSMFFAGSGGLGSAAVMTIVIALGVGATLAASRLLTATLLRGMPSSFALELPPYRLPRIGRVIVRSILDRTLFVLGRAAIVAAPAGLALWALSNIAPGGESLLARFTEFLDPLGRAFGMDGTILAAFILGLPANEIVLPIAVMAYSAAGSLGELPALSEMRSLLEANGWTYVTAACTLVFSIMHWPCSTTLLTIKKETGKLRWMLAAAALPTAFGLALCFIIATIAKLAGI